MQFKLNSLSKTLSLACALVLSVYSQYAAAERVNPYEQALLKDVSKWPSADEVVSLWTQTWEYEDKDSGLLVVMQHPQHRDRLQFTTDDMSIFVVSLERFKHEYEQLKAIGYVMKNNIVKIEEIPARNARSMREGGREITHYLTIHFSLESRHLTAFYVESAVHRDEEFEQIGLKPSKPAQKDSKDNTVQEGDVMFEDDDMIVTAGEVYDTPDAIDNFLRNMRIRPSSSSNASPATSPSIQSTWDCTTAANQKILIQETTSGQILLKIGGNPVNVPRNDIVSTRGGSTHITLRGYVNGKDLSIKFGPAGNSTQVQGSAEHNMICTFTSAPRPGDVF